MKHLKGNNQLDQTFHGFANEDERENCDDSVSRLEDEFYDSVEQIYANEKFTECVIS